MFGKTVVFVIIAKGILVFFVPCGELSSCLSHIRLIAIRAGEFVCARLRVWVRGVVFGSEKFSYGVVCPEGYFEFCVSEKVHDVGCFFPSVSERGPF